MLKGEKICNKAVAMVLVFYFTFATCFTLLSNFSYAETEKLGKQSSENNSNNIEYNVNLTKGDNNLEYEYVGSIDSYD